MKKIEFSNVLNSKGEGKLDFPLLISIIILLCVGIIMVSSASSYSALANYDNSNYFLTKQLGFAIVGILAMLVISKIDYRKYKKFSYIFFIVAIILMVLVLTPLGVNVNGAKRWLGVGNFFRFQPSEIMKIALIFATATYLYHRYPSYREYRGKRQGLRSFHLRRHVRRSG